MEKNQKIVVNGHEIELKENQSLSEEELGKVVGGAFPDPTASAFQGKCVSSPDCSWKSPYLPTIEGAYDYLKAHFSYTGHKDFEINEKNVTLE